MMTALMWMMKYQMPKKMKVVETIKQSEETEAGKEILGRIEITSIEESLTEM